MAYLHIQPAHPSLQYFFVIVLLLPQLDDAALLLLRERRSQLRRLSWDRWLQV